MEQSKGYMVTKTYPHSNGLSCVYRQYKASSHCSKLHGYALQFEVTFHAKELDENGWVIDFGSLDWIHYWLKRKFDHTTLVAKDDPYHGRFEDLDFARVADVVWVDGTGCESFAKMLMDHIHEYIKDSPRYMNKEGEQRVTCSSVTCKEHEGNKATIYNGGC